MGQLIDLSEAAVYDTAGNQLRLGDIVDRPTIIDLVRYYGCAPCRSQLADLADVYDEIEERGGAVLAIGPHAAYQAQLLAERRALPFPLLLDPDRNVGRAVGMHRQTLLRFVFDLRAWLRWVKGFFRSGQGKITSPYWETPGMLVVDASCRVRWAHRGKAIGDYPALSVTLEHLADAIANRD